MDRMIQIAGLVLCYWTLLVVNRCYFHPLAKYPGPVLAKVTGIYTTSLAFSGKKTYATHDMHKKYGSIVRIGPNELSFSDEQSIKDIYGQSGERCRKAPYFYGGFTLTGADSVFSAVDPGLHSRMRRLLSHGLSQQSVLRFESEVRSKIERYLAVIDSSTQPVDLHDLTHNLYLDIISSLAFGRSFDTLSGKEHGGARDISTYFEICPLFGQLPWARHLPFGIFRAARLAHRRIIPSVQGVINDFREQLKSAGADHGLLQSMIEARDEATGTVFSDAELIENAVIFLLAGSGTSASTVVYLLYEMARRPEMQKRLEDEIRQACPDSSRLPQYSQVEKLPLLNCVLQETLRLRGPANAAAPRVSPGKVISNNFIPSGVFVSSQPYTTGRDPSLFPNPDEFLPERWESATPEMKTMSRPFLSGPHVCIGMHLARMQILLTVSALYQRFDLVLDYSQMTDGMMVLRDLGLMTPVGKKLWMHARPRAQ